MDLTKNNYRHLVIRTTQNLLVILLLLFVFAACSNDDEIEQPFIKTEAAVMTFTEINNCTFPGNVQGTTYLTRIKYQSSKGTEISKILIDNEWSDGVKDSWESTNFTAANGELHFSSCFGFENTDWIKTGYTLVSKDGLKSNPSIATINKPNGAK